MQSYKKNLNFSNADNRIEILSHLGFFVFIGFSAWFHDLRSTFGESAMILFNLINEPKIFSNYVWFSAHWFQNLMTVLAVKSNLSLPLISLVFSVAPSVFLYGIFLTVNYGFKQKKSGLILLLLLLGINQTFFVAVHTPLILVATFYLIIEGFRAVLKKYRSDFCPLVEMGIWAVACLSLFLFISIFPNAYIDITYSVRWLSPVGYFSSVAVSTFVVSFLMAAYLILFWIYRKQIKPLILFGIWAISTMALIFIFGRNNLLDVNFELLFFPLIAGFVGFFMLFLAKEFEQSITRFWILCVLVAFAIFGQLRTVRDFEKRQTDVVRLLQHLPKTADKIALPERIQQLERYIDPTYLAFETPIIASLHGLPVQSAFFIPNDMTKIVPSIPERNTLNPSYFHFFSPNYIIHRNPIFRLSPITKIVRDTVVVTGGDVQFALTEFPRLQRGDLVLISAYRKGSNYGSLVISDNLRVNTRLWQWEQYTSEPDSAGWQKLSTEIFIEKTDVHRIYVMNRNFRNEQIYFKNFRIEIWREE